MRRSTNKPKLETRMALCDSGVTYDSGILCDEPMPTTQTKMIQLKLELQDKSDAKLKEFSLTHINKMNGSAAFPRRLLAPWRSKPSMMLSAPG